MTEECNWIYKYWRSNKPLIIGYIKSLFSIKTYEK